MQYHVWRQHAITVWNMATCMVLHDYILGSHEKRFDPPSGQVRKLISGSIFEINFADQKIVFLVIKSYNREAKTEIQ